MPRIVSLEDSIQIFRHFRVGVPRKGAGYCGIQFFFVTGSDFSVQLQIISFKLSFSCRWTLQQWPGYFWIQNL